MNAERDTATMPPRPQIYRAEVYIIAAQEYFRMKDVHPAVDQQPEKEDWLRECFMAALRSKDGEPREAWELARQIVGLADIRRTNALPAYCEGFLEHVAEHQELLQYDWVTAYGIENPVLTANRVIVKRWTGVGFREEEGLALPGGDYEAIGKFCFLSDGRLDGVDGELFGGLVLDWETIILKKPLTDCDVALLERSEEARCVREGEAACRAVCVCQATPLD
jgi:hypothetical protein